MCPTTDRRWDLHEPEFLGQHRFDGVRALPGNGPFLVGGAHFGGGAHQNTVLGKRNHHQSPLYLDVFKPSISQRPELLFNEHCLSCQRKIGPFGNHLDCVAVPFSDRTDRLGTNIGKWTVSTDHRRATRICSILTFAWMYVCSKHSNMSSCEILVRQPCH